MAALSPAQRGGTVYEAIARRSGVRDAIVATLQAGPLPSPIGDMRKAALAAIVLPAGWLIASRLLARQSR